MTLEDRLKEFHSGDEEQLSFIFSDKPRLIVNAPAGCGKTTAMVSKIARELSLGNIESNKKVLAMSFSVNASIRIKSDVKELLPSLVDNSKLLLKKLDIANYHNFAMRLLYKYGFLLNEEFINLSEFRIISDSIVIKENLISSSDNYIIEELIKIVTSFDFSQIESVMDQYWETINNTLINKKIITYNGILIAAKKLLSNDNIKKFYTNYYSMIIIDEFQDTNILSYYFIKSLIDNNKVVFLGDGIQRIYGFLGALDDVFQRVETDYSPQIISFKNNYRYNNTSIKELDHLIRAYVDQYIDPKLESSILIKKLQSDTEEVNFISEGIKNIIESNCNVAILLRAGWQGGIIAEKLKDESIHFFNGLYSEDDCEFIDFYNVAIEEFYNNVSGNAVQSSLKKCLQAIKNREHEIYTNDQKKYIFDSLYKLLEKLFEVSKNWEGTTKERYKNIEFSLNNNGLKHMIEYLDEKVVLTTIHSAKGLEWDYVILPQMNKSVFPSWKHMCKKCHNLNSFKLDNDSCTSLLLPEMKTLFREELSVLYVALTRAKKNVFFTVNTGINTHGYPKKENCFINLPGINQLDFAWNDYVS
ncbi:UvrD/REP helicase [Veillonella dispar ATCC 17748]|uniref:DNA 3'-5' helicase n=1 Tax=Veillonella dispar ATCC 17748 TaxID=546273 RepID=C4FPP5_9FIRM|nr:ATP-dependent helicase [Veillonella dispar]EEP65783.1 UvrD/REP helicase [Veillonella dispar ATCC 17748]VEG93295.1 DNA helicase II [Veillonella dispar]